MWSPRIRFSVRQMMVAVAFCAPLMYLSLNPMRMAAMDRGCQANLRAIGLALQSYHASYGCYPPAYTTDAQGRPAHSWRVLILPFAGEHALYQAYRMDEPWNGPNNSRLTGRMPAFYRCPIRGRSAPSSYAVVVGPETAFPGSGSTSISQIEDGTVQTMLVAELGGMGIPWMEPRDLRMELREPRMVPGSQADWQRQSTEYGRALYDDLSRQGLASGDHHPHKAKFLSAAGEVGSLSTRDGHVLHAIFTIKGQDPWAICPY